MPGGRAEGGYTNDEYTQQEPVIHAERKPPGLRPPTGAPVDVIARNIFFMALLRLLPERERKLPTHRIVMLLRERAPPPEVSNMGRPFSFAFRTASEMIGDLSDWSVRRFR